MTPRPESPGNRPQARLPLKVLVCVPFVVLLLLSTGLIAWLSLENGRQAAGDLAQQLRAEALIRVQASLAAYLDIPHQVNRANALAMATGQLDLDRPESWQRHFRNAVAANPAIAYSFFGTPQGEFYGARRHGGAVQVIRAGRETGGDSQYFRASEAGLALEREQVFRNFDPRTRPWYKAGAAAGQAAWSPIYRHFVLKDMALTAALPVYGPGGELRGVFGVDYVLNRIHGFLETLRVGAHGEVFLVERNGDLVASSWSVPDGLMRERNGTFHRVLARDCGSVLAAGAVAFLDGLPRGLAGVREEVSGSFDLDGEAQWLQAAPFTDGRGVDWLVAVAVPESDFLGRVNSRTGQTLLFVLLALGGTVFISLFMAGRIVRPVERMSRAADALARGDWDADPGPDPSGGRELVRLTGAFRSMGEQLRALFQRLSEQNEIIALQNRTLEARVAERTTELRQLHDKLRAIFDAIPGHVHVIDRSFRVVDVGDKMLQALGLVREQVIGRLCHEVFRGLPSVCATCLLNDPANRDCVATRTSTPEEEQTAGMAYMVYSAPVRGDQGQVWGFIECLMDISELRAMERELSRAKAQAEEANQAKSDFLAKMSHEMRTPLNSILGLTTLALDTPLAPDQREHLAAVHEAGRLLLDLISDLLDFAKIEAGAMELHLEHFSLPRVVASIIRTLKPLARKKGLRLILRMARWTPRYYQGDPSRLRQVLLNLLGNAIKFTAQGSVELRVEARAEEGRMQVAFAVEDTGMGIPPAGRRIIFEPFRQADGSVSRRYGGTGLGLAICRQLATLMGGDITLESEVGRGSTFTLTVPLIPGDRTLVQDRQGPTASLEELRRRQRPLRILLAEDNPMNVRLATALLTRLGHSTEAVGNGREALEALRRTRFDVVLMDLEMPEMDGLTATRFIRAGAAGEQARGAPIIAMTAHALAGFKEQCLAAGMDGFVSKPIDFVAVAGLLGRLPRQGGQAPSPGPSGVLNVPAALERMDGDMALYRDLCGYFLRAQEDRRRSVALAWEQGDLGALAAAAHGLKGTCLTIGAEECAGIAGIVEEAARRGETQGLSGAVLELQEAILRAVEAVGTVVAQAQPDS